MRGARFSTLGLAVLLLGGCVTGGALDVTPEIAPGETPSVETQEAGLWMAMDKIEQRLRTSGRLVEDEALQGYVRSLVCELAGEYCGDIRVYVVDTPHFNATMAPNGYMEVWSGLLLRSTNEAQLAYVLGHELGHYLRRHSIKFWRDARRKTDLLILFKLLTAVGGVPGVGNIAEIVTLANIFAHSRDNEREADRVGFELMTRAGYDPHEAPKIWEILLKERKAAEAPNQLIFFSTHPSTGERIETLEALAEEWSAGRRPGRDGRARFLAHSLGFRGAMLRDELRLRDFKRTQVLFDHLMEAGGKVGELHFYQGELYRLRGETGDRAKAIEAYHEALGAPGVPAEAHRALGLMLARDGRAEDALAAFGAYLEGAPDAADHAIVRAWLDQPGTIAAMARPERPAETDAAPTEGNRQ